MFIIAGSPSMLGAAALTGLAAMRSGAGLVSIGVPRSLINVLQKKISNVIMAVPLPESSDSLLKLSDFKTIRRLIERYRYTAIAIGPGLSHEPASVKSILTIIKNCPLPIVIDADALTALTGHLPLIEKKGTAKILTPHPGEMARLIGQSKNKVEANRQRVAEQFVRKYPCTLLLKGHRTIVAEREKKTYLNKTGNVGMATAGSGDVLTGMIGAFLAQGIPAYEAAQIGAYLHGKAGDMSAKKFGKASLIASDLIDYIPQAITTAAKP